MRVKYSVFDQNSPANTRNKLYIIFTTSKFQKKRKTIDFDLSHFRPEKKRNKRTPFFDQVIFRTWMPIYLIFNPENIEISTPRFDQVMTRS